MLTPPVPIKELERFLRAVDYAGQGASARPLLEPVLLQGRGGAARALDLDFKVAASVAAVQVSVAGVACRATVPLAHHQAGNAAQGLQDGPQDGRFARWNLHGELLKGNRFLGSLDVGF
jgi:hypothetical protein